MAPMPTPPIMRFGNEMRRSDLSATVWLNPPASYDGGELVVHLGTRPVVIKGEPGACSRLYSSVRDASVGHRHDGKFHRHGGPTDRGINCLLKPAAHPTKSRPAASAIPAAAAPA